MSFQVPLYIVVLIGLAYVFASFRRGKVSRVSKSGSTRTLQIAADPDLVFKTLSGPFDRYKVDDADATRRIVVLSIPPSLFAWGFFFPVWIEASPSGGSLVEIGIESKLFQWGPIVSRAHTRCVASIEGLLRPAAARVVAA